MQSLWRLIVSCPPRLLPLKLKLPLVIIIMLHFVFLATNSSPSFAEEQQAGTQASLSNANFEVNAPSVRDVLLLIVDKEKLKAELRTWPLEPSDSKKIAEFRVAIGKVAGDKEFQGDKKTPEGIYTILDQIDGSTLPAKYGPLAIPLDFPNPMDILDRKTGYGIWLHGVESDDRVEAANVTDGCVAFYNADIERLGRLLKPYQAVVAITDSFDESQMLTASPEVKQNTLAWYDAWRSRDLERYLSFYDDEFRFNGKSMSDFRAYKSRVFSSYKNMSVEHQGIRVFVHKKYALAVMNQNFIGDNRFFAKGRKVLYWQKQLPGTWQIQHESFSERLLKPTELSQNESWDVTKLSSHPEASSAQ